MNVKDMMTAYVHLKDLQKSGWIMEVARGVWLRSPVTKFDATHGEHLCALSFCLCF